MSACGDFRDLMLEAEPAELRGVGDSPLAGHLRECPSCARAAAVLLEDTGRLEAFLGDATAPDVEALLRRAGVAVEGPRRTLGRSRIRRLPMRYLWMPAAAAAALATLLLLHGPQVPLSSPGVAPASRHASLPLVEPVAGQDAAVLPTEDPNITVVWLFKTG